MKQKAIILLFCMILLVSSPVFASHTITILPNKLIFGPMFSDFAHERGAVNNVNATGDYSGSPVVFEVAPPEDEYYAISRLIVQIEDTQIRFPERYGDIIITNGIKVLVNTSLGKNNLTADGHEIKSNLDWAKYSFDNDLVIFPSGSDFIKVRWTFAKSGTFLLLNGSAGDCLQIVLNDDFSGLEAHTFLIQGYILEEESMEFLQEEQEVNNMLPLIIGLSVIIVGFAFLGSMTRSFGVRFGAFGLAGVQGILMLAYLYMTELGISIISLLKLNFLIMLIVGFGIAIIAMYQNSARMVVLSDGTNSDTKHKWDEEGDKW